MGCRSEKRALAAREKLLDLLDVELERRRNKGASAEDVEFANQFRESLELDFVPCDLASIDATFSFCDAVTTRHAFPDVHYLLA